MIPESFVENWGQKVAPWQTLGMVEQDLVISRALVDLFNNDTVKNNLVFRGGTALNKLYLKPPARYSEDLDFVQTRAEPIGPTIDAIRTALSPWLGEPKRKQTERSVKLVYRYTSVDNTPAKLKIEINTTEHFSVLDLQCMNHTVTSEWFRGSGTIITYHLEELMATKLRALYQRRKGRDLFDLWFVCGHDLVNVDQVVILFHKYCAHDGLMISKDVFINNMHLKRTSNDFRIDMDMLLPIQMKWDFETAFDFVQCEVIDKLQF
jgi:predicted nucleotidyltransferase component of viral defense system